MMGRTGCLRVGLLLAILAWIFGVRRTAAQEVDTKNSVWNTVYTLDDGKTKIGAKMILNGARGQYTTLNGEKGVLSNIQYGENGSITGDWKFEGQATGEFELYVRGEAFYGMWSDGGDAVYPWSGTLEGATTLKWAGFPGENAGSVAGISQATKLPNGWFFTVTYDRRNGRVLRQTIERKN